MSGTVGPTYPDIARDTLKLLITLGERTPVGVRMQNPPGNIPAYWNLCKAARQFKAAVMGDGNATKSIEILRLSERTDGYSEVGEWYVKRAQKQSFPLTLSTVYQES